MIKKSLLSALAALILIPEISLAATTADLENGPNATWPAKQTLTTLDDGLVGHGAQTLFINITSLPPEGASYRTYKSYRNPVNGVHSGATAITSTGPITITVPAAGGDPFARNTNVQFSSDAIEFDQLYINGVSAMPVTAPAVGTQGIGHPISQAGNYFDPLTNPDWVQAISLTTLADGASSQGVQTLEMNVTYIPEGGVQYRVYKSFANPEFGTFEAVQDITDTGPISISVNSVDFDRLVKVQFSSDAVEFDALTINGNTLWPIDTSGSLVSTGNVNLGLLTENTYWPTAIDLTTKADGVASHGEQTLVINVTSLPAEGAVYQVIKTLRSDLGGDDSGDDSGDGSGDGSGDDGGDDTDTTPDYTTYPSLYLGVNTIIVPAIEVDADNPAFDRLVRIRFNSDAIEFNSITVNGQALWPIDTSGNKVTLANSNLFNDSANEGWAKVLTLAVRQDGSTSQNEQTVELYVTDLPESGANYQIYRTLEDVENNYTSDPIPLSLGPNTISVIAEDGAFDRAVKIRFDSDAIEYKLLSINGNSRLIGANLSEAPSVSIDGTTLTWTETDGATLQYSEDLNTWISHPSATSPYTPSGTGVDRFYRTISDE